MEAQTISNAPASTATGNGAPPPSSSPVDRRPIHPAMDFDQADGVAFDRAC